MRARVQAIIIRRNNLLEKIAFALEFHMQSGCSSSHDKWYIIGVEFTTPPLRSEYCIRSVCLYDNNFLKEILVGTTRI